METKLDFAIARVDGIIGFLNLPWEGTPHFYQPLVGEVIFSRSQAIKEERSMDKTITKTYIVTQLGMEKNRNNPYGDFQEQDKVLHMLAFYVIY
jgi:hypothetical protein